MIGFLVLSFRLFKKNTLVIFFIALAAMLAISSCGKKGPLTLPADKTSQPEN